MNKEKIANVLDSLSGISYFDWQKIKIAVDEDFSSKKKEYERELKLNSTEETQKSILRQFE